MIRYWYLQEQSVGQMWLPKIQIKAELKRRRSTAINRKMPGSVHSRRFENTMFKSWLPRMSQQEELTSTALPMSSTLIFRLIRKAMCIALDAPGGPGRAALPFHFALKMSGENYEKFKNYQEVKVA